MIDPVGGHQMLCHAATLLAGSDPALCCHKVGLALRQQTRGGQLAAARIFLETLGIAPEELIRRGSPMPAAIAPAPVSPAPPHRGRRPHSPVRMT